VRQQACKTQIPPYGLTRRAPPIPTAAIRFVYSSSRKQCRRRDFTRAKVHQNGTRPVRIVVEQACEVSRRYLFPPLKIHNRTNKKQTHSKLSIPHTTVWWDNKRHAAYNNRNISFSRSFFRWWFVCLSLAVL